MARFDGKFIHGVAGNIIFKQDGDQQIIVGKSKKDKIDMTQATYDASFVFGWASTLAAYIRVNASPVIPFNDGGMISRFTGECNQVIQKALPSKNHVFDFSQEYFSRLNGFEFHKNSPVKNHLFAQPIVTLTEENVTIDLPEMGAPKDLKFPLNASYCVMAFSVTLYDLNNTRFKSQEVQTIEIEYANKPMTIPAQQLNFEGAPGALCIVAVGLYYLEKTFAGKAVINNKEMSPAAVLRAEFCPGEAQVINGWQQMSFNSKKKRKIKKSKKKA